MVASVSRLQGFCLGAKRLRRFTRQRCARLGADRSLEGVGEVAWSGIVANRDSDELRWVVRGKGVLLASGFGHDKTLQKGAQPLGGKFRVALQVLGELRPIDHSVAVVDRKSVV